MVKLRLSNVGVPAVFQRVDEWQSEFAFRYDANAKSRPSSWRKLFKPAAQGALPTLYAATSPAAEGGSYYGPDGWNELRGYPGLAVVPDRAKDSVVASRLWISRKL
jgi:hypothetical protein